MNFSSIDIFCHCVDNFGDAGVVYRFAREFKASNPRCRTRVFIDSKETLRAIVKEIDPSKAVQELESILYIDTRALTETLMENLGAADIMVEAFACHIPEPLLEQAYSKSKLIINLEYLSAESWVEGFHLKESLLGCGTARKFFFMPGFTEATGGLILNSRLAQTRYSGGFDRFQILNDVLNTFGITVKPEENKLLGTLFTYERGLDSLLTDLNTQNRKATLLVFGDKSQKSISAALERLGGRHDSISAQIRTYKNVQLICMPFIDQHSYDTLLCCTDFNFVRGEDSLARAVLSGKPFIWNAYIQDNKYQKVKVEALLETMRPFYKNENVFNDYSKLMLTFNDAPEESAAQTTSERYVNFLKNLKKHERAAEEMSYFMHLNCNLIEKFNGFLRKN
ncbi:MAG: elongation factor P maturation arginine rhamnosyltransferase EarP [Chitinispirillales bacterium]|jgi:uncharacterized repeat protein (TIGR03837 family)|nr:elongation factor P maturation arginine rhamnosyltransferase EarP [Chitinispirillales bacterium]